MTPPFFSIIIRCHRRALQLRAALQSVLEQDTNDYNIVAILDDPSDYRSVAVIEEYKKAGMRIHLHFVAVPLGFPGCNLYLNTAATLATGNFLLYLDDDDKYGSPDLLSTIRANLGDKTVGIIRMRINGFVVPDNLIWGVGVHKDRIGAPCICIERTLARRCKWGDSQTGDFEFILSAYEKVGGDVAWINRVGITSSPSFGKSDY